MQLWVLRFKSRKQGVADRAFGDRMDRKRSCSVLSQGFWFLQPCLSKKNKVAALFISLMTKVFCSLKATLTHKTMAANSQDSWPQGQTPTLVHQQWAGRAFLSVTRFRVSAPAKSVCISILVLQLSK